LDPSHACLWRGTEAVSLPPKAFAVLYDLVTYLAGRLDDAGIQAQRALDMTF